MVKTSGAEWNKFYTDPELWGNETWHDDTTVTVDGTVVEDLDTPFSATATVLIDGGAVYVNGSQSDSAPSMETYFRRWKKNQTTIFLSVECPREKYEAITLAIKTAGGKFKA